MAKHIVRLALFFCIGSLSAADNRSNSNSPNDLARFSSSDDSQVSPRSDLRNGQQQNFCGNPVSPSGIELPALDVNSLHQQLQEALHIIRNLEEQLREKSVRSVNEKAEAWKQIRDLQKEVQCLRGSCEEHEDGANKARAKVKKHKAKLAGFRAGVELALKAGRLEKPHFKHSRHKRHKHRSEKSRAAEDSAHADQGDFTTTVAELQRSLSVGGVASQEPLNDRNLLLLDGSLFPEDSPNERP